MLSASRTIVNLITPQVSKVRVVLQCSPRAERLGDDRERAVWGGDVTVLSASRTIVNCLLAADQIMPRLSYSALREPNDSEGYLGWITLELW